jgi:hypothetical protein
VKGPEAHRVVFGEMLDRALIALTRKPTTAAAWRSILRADDVVGLPQIRDKLRLCLVDATPVMFDKGLEPSALTASDEGILVAAFDPVAADSVGTTIMNDVRRENGLDPI